MLLSKARLEFVRFDNKRAHARIIGSCESFSGSTLLLVDNICVQPVRILIRSVDAVMLINKMTVYQKM